MTETPALPICAILDDYQDVAMKCADWSKLNGRVILRRESGGADLIERLSDCTIIVAMRERTPFLAQTLARLPNLRLLITTGMRNRSIDMEAARQAGIDVCGTGAAGSPAAELAWASLLAFMREIPAETAGLRANGPWQSRLGRSLYGRRLGIIGLGKVGRKLATFGQAFGMEVGAWTRTDLEERSSQLGISALTLPELFRTSDVVAVQLALTPETHGFVTPEFLAMMHSDAVLLNTARGPLVDEAALIEALHHDRIGGAVLDVFDQEPLPKDHPFRSLPNVLATPHLGYVTEENYRAYYSGAVEDILAWLDGHPTRTLN